MTAALLRFGIQPAFHAFMSMAKYEKALCRMNIDHKPNSKLVYKPFCQAAAFCSCRVLCSFFFNFAEKKKLSRLKNTARFYPTWVSVLD